MDPSSKQKRKMDADVPKIKSITGNTNNLTISDNLSKLEIMPTFYRSVCNHISYKSISNKRSVGVLYILSS